MMIPDVPEQPWKNNHLVSLWSLRLQSGTKRSEGVLDNCIKQNFPQVHQAAACLSLREGHMISPCPAIRQNSPSSPVAMRHTSPSQGFHNSLQDEQKPSSWTKQGSLTQTSSHLTHTSHLQVLWLTYKWTIQGFSFQHFFFSLCPGIYGAKSHRLPQWEVNGWIILHSFQYPMRGFFLIAWCWKADNQVQLGLV